ncbi:hypothetical protein [Flammeovirga aprica]|uniref:Leucine-rich repeat domain-containing protein n=1 Tax=Flammeovirga aprica JL-4 TaxID=694437 RepID=A0A7X9S1Q4_9BACT|nr:hypothetical protein [Flammeovirga aprica]NME72743.1 hypothetical protein [Flammeovirga aprica JL-4]
MTKRKSNTDAISYVLKKCLAPYVLEQFLEPFYKKYNQYWIEALRGTIKNKALRREIIDKHLFNLLSQRPNNLGHVFQIPFYKDELDYVLSHEMFGEKLKRINIEVLDRLSGKLLEFPNIKEINIKGLPEDDFKNIICKLPHVQELRLGNFYQITSDIAQLKHLKTLRINFVTKENCQIVDELFELEELKEVFLNGEEYRNWQEEKLNLQP